MRLRKGEKIPLTEDETAKVPALETGKLPCKTCGEMIDKEKLDLHSVYCERNMTQCSYCKAKINKKYFDVHVREERGEPNDLIEAIANGRLESIQTMLDHGNDIYRLDERDSSLMHHAVKNLQLKSIQLLL